MTYYKEASTAGIARTLGGAAIGGYMGRNYGDAQSDGSNTGKTMGMLGGAIAGGLAGLGVHGLRRMGGSGAAFNKTFSSGNALAGVMGAGAAAGAGYGGAKFLKTTQPDYFRPDFVTQKERRENTDIQMLAQQLKASGGHFDRMHPDDAAKLREYMSNPATRSRTMRAYEGPRSKVAGELPGARAAGDKVLQKYMKMHGGNLKAFNSRDNQMSNWKKSYNTHNKLASYAQFYSRGPEGGRTLVPYNDPRAISMIQSEAFQNNLKKMIALRQLSAMQQMQQTYTPEYRDAAADKFTQSYLSGNLQRPQPTEDQARSMINQYMSQAGVDTATPKAQSAADKYDGTPPPEKTKEQKAPKKSKKQQPVQIKSKSQKKEAGMRLQEVQLLEKVAGSPYPTDYHQDGSVSKNINGVVHVFDTNGILKTASMAAIRNMGTLGKAGLGAGALAVAGGLGYGGKKLYDYLNRDQRTTWERTVDAGQAALPHMMASYKAYQAMQNQLNQAANPNHNLVMQNQAPNPAMAGLNMDGRQLAPEDLLRRNAMAGYSGSQFNPSVGAANYGYRPIQ
jgi:hypothetical protein